MVTDFQGKEVYLCDRDLLPSQRKRGIFTAEDVADFEARKCGCMWASEGAMRLGFGEVGEAGYYDDEEEEVGVTQGGGEKVGEVEKVEQRIEKIEKAEQKVEQDVSGPAKSFEEIFERMAREEGK
jgi:hypothetical protein